jgi:uncharacterized RDD family membrane protein YckC
MMPSKEDIELELNREGMNIAPFSKRAFSAIIDELLISLLVLFGSWNTLVSQPDTSALIAVLNGMFFMIIGLKIVYQTAFVTMYGATVGKILMKIRVIDAATKSHPTPFISFQRALVRILSESMFYVGFLWAFSGVLRQTWHDLVAKTVVIDA